jgi:selenide,water dikinase
VQTVDFFTPVVDDPRTFGKVAAANALSDVYAMGAVPVTALNVVGYPLKRLGPEPLREILAGGLDKIHEAGACLVGGHTVEDAELKYGLAVTGTVRPDAVVRNGGARPGDRLILTKAIGTGAVATALKQGKASEAAVAAMVESMIALNRSAAEAMVDAGASGCTDITGYGLVGHGLEMADAAGVGFEIAFDCLPLLPEALDCILAGAVCGGTKRNREHYADRLAVDDGLDEAQVVLACDAQTSGGLLVSIAEDRADRFVRALRDRGVVAAADVGCVTAESPGRIRLRASES